MPCPLPISAGSSITLTTSASLTIVEVICQYGTAKVVDIKTGSDGVCQPDLSGTVGCTLYPEDVKSFFCDKSDMELVLSASASFSNPSGSAMVLFDDDVPLFSRGLLNTTGLHIFYAQPTVTCYGVKTEGCLPPGTSVRDFTGNLLNSSCIKYEFESNNVTSPSTVYGFNWGVSSSKYGSLDDGTGPMGITNVHEGLIIVIALLVLMFCICCCRPSSEPKRSSYNPKMVVVC